jgi:curved DNA-binding protein CbpA
VGEDPFDILGLPPAFDHAPAAIERAYLARAASVHPDLVGDDDEAAVRAAKLNRAKSVLLNPEQRANALLARLGGPSKAQDKSLPPGFLIEMMETREAIEAAIATGNPEERGQWDRWALEQRSEYVSHIGELFGQVAKDPGKLAQIRQKLNAWRYIERLIEQLDPKYNPSSDLNR